MSTFDHGARKANRRRPPKEPTLAQLLDELYDLGSDVWPPLAVGGDRS